MLGIGEANQPTLGSEMPSNPAGFSTRIFHGRYTRDITVRRSDDGDETMTHQSAGQTVHSMTAIMDPESRFCTEVLVKCVHTRTKQHNISPWFLVDPESEFWTENTILVPKYEKIYDFDAFYIKKSLGNALSATIPNSGFHKRSRSTM